jgi:hypothetical protein
VVEDRALVQERATLEEQAKVLEVRIVERVGESVRARHHGAVLEQDPQALRALGLARVVDRLVVVRVRARLQEDACHPRVVDDPGRAVDGGHRPVLVDEVCVRVGSACEQLPQELHRREDGMRHVQDRRPAERAAGLVRIAVPAATERQRNPGIALELGPRSEQRLSPCATPLRRRPDKGLHARLEVVAGPHVRDPSTV